jgi:hypothetical protein
VLPQYEAPAINTMQFSIHTACSELDDRGWNAIRRKQFVKAYANKPELSNDNTK